MKVGEAGGRRGWGGESGLCDLCDLCGCVDGGWVPVVGVEGVTPPTAAPSAGCMAGMAFACEDVSFASGEWSMITVVRTTP